MIKKIYFILSLIFCIALVTGCGASGNKSIDKSLFTRARINQAGTNLWNVNVKSWEDFGQQIQIETADGQIVLVDKSNVILLGK